MDDTEQPLAYTIGDQPFLGLTIYLDSRPLIPRPETEWWTEQLLREGDTFPTRNVGHRKSHMKFLDLCAGSGAIGCAALAKFPNAQVYFGEIDPAHEATILKNIRENNLDESRAHVCIGDLFDPLPAEMKFDVIAANPPYVPCGRDLPASVTNYEPPLALYAGADGLDIIRRIAISVRCHLTESGVVWLECDSEHAETAQGLFASQNFTAELRADQYGQPRVIIARPI
ncbi:MAG: HemK family protein methyltransferase [Candidatus Paceibacterota bacterium]|jgi:release factor glutamine methyltransferase